MSWAVPKVFRAAFLGPNVRWVFEKPTRSATSPPVLRIKLGLLVRSLGSPNRSIVEPTTTLITGRCCTGRASMFQKVVL